MVLEGWTESDLSEGVGAVLQFIAVMPYATPLNTFPLRLHKPGGRTMLSGDSGLRRTGFRDEAEHRSGLIPNAIPG
jgi:hypothetical protein